MFFEKFYKYFSISELKKEDLDYLYESLIESFQVIHKKPSYYKNFMLYYLSFAVNRDELKDIRVQFASKLLDTTFGSVYYSPYEGNSLTRIVVSTKKQIFHKFKDYQGFFKAIDTIEHEIAHIYDYENWPLEYHKFKNETGRTKTSSDGSQFMRTLFYGTPYEKIASVWRATTYHNNRLETFARRRAQIATTQLFEDLKETYSETEDWQEIENGFNQYEANITKTKEIATKWTYELFTDKDIFEDGIVFSDLKKEFDKVIDATVKVDFSALPYLDNKKKKLIFLNLFDLNRLALNNTIYHQENIDKLFDFQINLRTLNFTNLAMLVMHPNNKNSDKHIKILHDKAKAIKREKLLQKVLDAYTPRQRDNQPHFDALEL